MPEYVSPDYLNPLGSDHRAGDRWVNGLRNEGANETIVSKSLCPKARRTPRFVEHKPVGSPRSAATPNFKPVPHYQQPIHRFKQRKCSEDALRRLRCKLIGVATDSDDFLDSTIWPSYFQGQDKVSFDEFFDTVNKALAEAGTPLELDEPSVLVSVLSLTIGAPVDVSKFVQFLFDEGSDGNDDLPPPPDSDEDDDEYQLGGVPLTDDFETRRRKQAFTSKPCDTPEVADLTVAEKMRIRNKVLASCYTFEGMDVAAEFHRMDKNHSGAISRDELASALLRRGVSVPLSKFKKFLSDIDTDEDGNVTLEEFCRFLGVVPRAPKRRSRKKALRKDRDDGTYDSETRDEDDETILSSSDDEDGPGPGDLWINTLRNDAPASRPKPQTLHAKYVAHSTRHRSESTSALSDDLVRQICNKLTAAAYCYRGGADIAAHFKRLDRDHDGSLSYEEFIHAVKKLCPITDDESMALLQLVDQDGDGVVAYNEFAYLLKPVKKALNKSVKKEKEALSPRHSPKGIRVEGENEEEFIERLSSPKSTLSRANKEREPKEGEPVYDSRQFYEAMRKTQLRRALGSDQKQKQTRRAREATPSSSRQQSASADGGSQRGGSAKKADARNSTSKRASARKQRRRPYGMSDTDQKIQAFLMGKLK